MSAKNIVMAAAGGSAATTYVDDVFSTYLYNGNGSTQTITNGVDLAGKGGLVWMKTRSAASNSSMYDTSRGATNELQSQTANPQATRSDGLTAFNSTGFNLGAFTNSNTNSQIYASWTFRKAPKFFDVVTYTGNGSNRTIAHNLGSVPGCIAVKRTDTTADWQVYHRSLLNSEYMSLSSLAGKATGATRWNSTTATSTEFSLGTDTTVNADTGTYVAYLFAHDTAADGLIQCGSFTGTGSESLIDLGWEPQWLLLKRTDESGNWFMLDTLRGWDEQTNEQVLYANATNAEAGVSLAGAPKATGFTIIATLNTTWVYVAIRRPNKPPTTGTQVFMPTVYTGTNVDNRLVNTTIAPDMVMVRQRTGIALAGMAVGDRLRGEPYLLTGSATAAEVSDPDSFDKQSVSAVEYGTAFSAMNGFWVGNDPSVVMNLNTTSNNHVALAFKRAPGFFDVVCYTGNGAATQTVPHNLGVAPELMIVKRRTAGGDNGWPVWTGAVDQIMWLNLNLQRQTFATNFPVAPTASAFTVGSGLDTGASGGTYVAYLFASLPGVSKVGTYTGNGASQIINCGFSTGARFVLLKRMDNASNWYVWDSARGIASDNDNHLSLNSSADEVTTDDSIDPNNSGFVVNQLGITNMNVTGATYIYLAIA